MLSTLDGEINTESLEVDNCGEDNNGGEQVHQVREVSTVESFTESSDFVASGGQQVEEGNYGSLEFSSTSSVHCGRREGLPNNGFADVGGDEEGNTRSKTVSFLEKFIEKKNDDTSNDELEDDQETDASTDFRWVSVHSRSDVNDSLTNSDDHTEH